MWGRGSGEAKSPRNTVAFYLARNGRQDEAREFFRQAMMLYRDKWGSLAKYEWLHSQSRVFMGLEEEGQQSRVGDIIHLRTT
jgi:hypothetical protein